MRSGKRLDPSDDAGFQFAAVTHGSERHDGLDDGQEILGAVIDFPGEQHLALLGGLALADLFACCPRGGAAC